MAVCHSCNPSPTARRDEQTRRFSPLVPSMMCLRDRPVALGALLPAGQHNGIRSSHGWATTTTAEQHCWYAGVLP